MKSLRELYKIGKGPSSSHTMGPERAAKLFLAQHAQADHFRVVLYDSLAKTGKGHMTDKVLINTFSPLPVEVIFDVKSEGFAHPNAMDMIAYCGENELDRWRVYSIGGGTIRIEGQDVATLPEVYPHTSFAEIAQYCAENDIRI